MKSRNLGGGLLVAVSIYITEFKSLKAPNITNNHSQPSPQPSQNSNPQTPQNLNTSQASTSQNLAQNHNISQNQIPPTFVEASSITQDSVINSSLDSVRDSATTSTQNTQTSQNLSGTQTAVSTTSQVLENIKIKIFIYMGLCIVGNIMGGIANALLNSYGDERSVGGFVLIIAFCVYICIFCVLYSAMETLWKRAKSKILKDNVGLYITMAILGWVGLGILLGMANNGYKASDGNDATFILLLVIVFLGCLIYSIVPRYRIYKEVAYITNQPLFLVAFWLGVTILLLPIAIIVYIIAWIMAKEIRESTSAEEYKKNKVVESNTDSVKWF